MRLKIWLGCIVLAFLGSACSLSAVLDPMSPQPFPESGIQPENSSAGEPASSVPEAQDNPSAESAPVLATPVADSPAAGICASFDGLWVTVTIRPDIPDPRCALIRPDQMLEVVNAREDTLQVGIGTMQVELAPGESHRFEVAFGEYLMPGGVHAVDVQPCCGGVLWFKDGGE